MSEDTLVTLDKWQKLSPKLQGYLVYMQADRPGSLLKGQKNPWPEWSQEYKDYQEGERLAMLDVQDSEE